MCDVFLKPKQALKAKVNILWFRVVHGTAITNISWKVDRLNNCFFLIHITY